MARTAFIFIGHSHLSSIVSALLPRAGESSGWDEGCEYFIFDTVRHGDNFQFTVPDPEEGFILNPVISDMVKETVNPEFKKIFVSMFGGNAHNALTLLEHPKPFDFILPENPSRERLKEALLLPSGYMRGFIDKLAEVYMLNLATLRHAFPDTVVHIESPPPVGSDSFLMANLDKYFEGQYDNPRPAPRELRYKLWRLHSAIIRDHAEAAGVSFLEYPQNTTDAQGFLLPAYYSNDATHAGPAYGLEVLKQLEARFNCRFDGWRWL